MNKTNAAASYSGFGPMYYIPAAWGWFCIAVGFLVLIPVVLALVVYRYAGPALKRLFRSHPPKGRPLLDAAQAP